MALPYKRNFNIGRGSEQLYNDESHKVFESVKHLTDSPGTNKEPVAKAPRSIWHDEPHNALKWWDPVTKKYGSNAVYVSELYDKNGDPIVPTTAGWGDDDWVPVEKTFAVGEGFWWGVGKDNCTLCIPNPFYVEEK